MNHWKVGGELQRPKNITRGLKSPNSVMKRSFVFVSFFDMNVIETPMNVHL